VAWKFPKRSTRQKSPIDIETINDNFHEFVSEVGNLNEHNWSGDTTINNGVVQIPYSDPIEAAVKVHHEYWWENHNIGGEDFDDDYNIFTPRSDGIEVNSHAYVPPYGPPEVTGIVYSPLVRNKPSWQRIKSITGTSQNSTFWIICSFFHYQADRPNDSEGADNFSEGIADGVVQYALRHNGRIIWESVTGSAEPDNDPLADRELHGPAAIVLDALIPATEGDFRVELVGRCGSSIDYTPIYVPTGEIIIFEFRR
jgi:hypothetical protein